MTLQTQERISDAARAGKYLTFKLGREEFGIGVMNVREIMGLQDVTEVPGTPSHLKGVINLRGKIIPVVDLRLKFALAEAEFTQSTCIIVVQVLQESETAMIGIIVDAVSEVLNFGSSDIEDARDFGTGTENRFVVGIAKFKGSVKILLQIEDILSLRELRGAQSYFS